jgi:hypothetical protein
MRKGGGPPACAVAACACLPQGFLCPSPRLTHSFLWYAALSQSVWCVSSGAIDPPSTRLLYAAPSHQVCTIVVPTWSDSSRTERTRASGSGEKKKCTGTGAAGARPG